MTEAEGAHPHFLLLHGQGATGAVWEPLGRLLKAAGAGSVHMPDLPGHGAAARLSSYTLEALARPLTPLLVPPIVLVGHSLGGYVALALAGCTGLMPRAVISIGAKQHFTEEERARALDYARRPARRFATRAEALERYRKVAGLDARIAAEEALLERGVRIAGDGFELAQDPKALSLIVPPFAALMASAHCPVFLARGEHDGLVSRPEQLSLDAGAHEFAGLGHNAHVEQPALVARHVLKVTSARP